MNPIHPKVGGAAIGGAVGVLVTAGLNSLHGVHVSPDVSAAIAAVLSSALGWLTPSAPAQLQTPVTPGGDVSAPVADVGPPIQLAFPETVPAAPTTAGTVTTELPPPLSPDLAAAAPVAQSVAQLQALVDQLAKDVGA